MIQCAKNYYAASGEDPDYIKCNDGKWSAFLLVCMENCKGLPRYEFRYVATPIESPSGTAPVYRHNARFNVTCAPGFGRIEGPAEGWEVIKCIDGGYVQKTLRCGKDCEGEFPYKEGYIFSAPAGHMPYYYDQPPWESRNASANASTPTGFIGQQQQLTPIAWGPNMIQKGATDKCVSHSGARSSSTTTVSPQLECALDGASQLSAADETLPWPQHPPHSFFEHARELHVIWLDQPSQRGLSTGQTPSHMRNVAVKRHAYQSSTQKEASASRAVDGNRNTDFRSESCAETDPNWPEANPWWYVDLNETNDVNNVVIYADSVKFRDLIGAMVYVGMSSVHYSNNTLCGTVHENTTAVIGLTCNTTVSGRYVWIVNGLGGQQQSNSFCVRSRHMRVADRVYLASGKTAFQEPHTDRGQDWSPQHAIDGDYTTIDEGGSCAHTSDLQPSDAPWWAVDLGDERTIDVVRVFTRDPTTKWNERLWGVQVRIGPSRNWKDNDLCGSLPSPMANSSAQQMWYDIGCDMQGQFVFLVGGKEQTANDMNDGILDVCEVEVYGPCGDGYLAPIAYEECDDKNVLSDDGCSYDCKVEPGWFCTNPRGLDKPSVCMRTGVADQTIPSPISFLQADPAVKTNSLGRPVPGDCVPDATRHKQCQDDCAKIGGILSSVEAHPNACCPKACGTCGGEDCYDRPGRYDCCAGSIEDKEDMCEATDKPPCLIEGDTHIRLSTTPQPTKEPEGETKQPVERPVSPVQVGVTKTDKRDWVTVKTSSFPNPVVIGGLPDMRGPDEAVVRIRNVKPGSFELKLDEPAPCSDQIHGETPIDWMVVEAGVYPLDTEMGLTVAAGTVPVAGDKKFVQVAFPPEASFTDAPILLVQVQSYTSGRVFVKQRVKGLSSSGFEVALETQGESLADPKNEANFGQEVLGWVAFSYPQKGVLEVKELKAAIIAGITPAEVDEKPYKINFGASMPDAHLFASIVTYNGWDAAQLRVAKQDEQGAEIFIQEETCSPLVLPHPNREKVSWMAMGALESTPLTTTQTPTTQVPTTTAPPAATTQAPSFETPQQEGQPPTTQAPGEEQAENEGNQTSPTGPPEAGAPANETAAPPEEVPEGTHPFNKTEEEEKLDERKQELEANESEEGAESEKTAKKPENETAAVAPPHVLPSECQRSPRLHKACIEACEDIGGLLSQSAPNPNACCPKTCGTCGSNDCEKRRGGPDSCCPAKIVAAGKICGQDTDKPPCLIAVEGASANETTGERNRTDLEGKPEIEPPKEPVWLFDYARASHDPGPLIPDGTIRKVQCRQSVGYRTYQGMEPEAQITCIDGVWTFLPLMCKRDCPLLYLAKNENDPGPGDDTVYIPYQFELKDPAQSMKYVKTGDSDQELPVHGVSITLRCRDSDIPGQAWHAVVGVDGPNAGVDDAFGRMKCVNGEWSAITLVCAKECSKTDFLELVPANAWAMSGLMTDATALPPEGGLWDSALAETFLHGSILSIACNTDSSPVYKCTTAEGLESGENVTEVVVPEAKKPPNTVLTNETIVCKNGTFTPTTMRCERMCELLPLEKRVQQSNGYLVKTLIDPYYLARASCRAGAHNGLAPGSTTPPDVPIRLECQPGYSPSVGSALALQGKHSVGMGISQAFEEILCEDGAWSQVTLDCRADCGEPPLLTPAEAYDVRGEGVTHGSFRDIQCAEGYTPGVKGTAAATTIHCHDGQWTMNRIVCYKNCPEYGTSVPMDNTRMKWSYETSLRIQRKVEGAAQEQESDGTAAGSAANATQFIDQGNDNATTNNTHGSGAAANESEIDEMAHGSLVRVWCDPDGGYYHHRDPQAFMHLICFDGEHTRPDPLLSLVLPLECRRACDRTPEETYGMTAENGYRTLDEETSTSESTMYHGTLRKIGCLTSTHTAEVNFDAKSSGADKWPGEMIETAAHDEAGQWDPIDVLECDDGEWVDRNLQCWRKCPEYKPPNPERYQVLVPEGETIPFKKFPTVAHGTRRQIQCNAKRITSGTLKGFRSGFYSPQMMLQFGPLFLDKKIGEKAQMVECKDGEFDTTTLDCQKMCPSIGDKMQELCRDFYLQLGPADQDEMGPCKGKGGKAKNDCINARCKDLKAAHTPYRIIKSLIDPDTATTKIVGDPDPTKMDTFPHFSRKPADVHLVICDESKGYAPTHRAVVDLSDPEHDPFASSIVGAIDCYDGQWSDLPFRCKKGCKGPFDSEQTSNIKTVIMGGEVDITTVGGEAVWFKKMAALQIDGAIAHNFTGGPFDDTLDDQDYYYYPSADVVDVHDLMDALDTDELSWRNQTSNDATVPSSFREALSALQDKSSSSRRRYSSCSCDAEKKTLMSLDSEISRFRTDIQRLKDQAKKSREEREKIERERARRAGAEQHKGQFGVPYSTAELKSARKYTGPLNTRMWRRLKKDYFGMDYVINKNSKTTKSFIQEESTEETLTHQQQQQKADPRTFLQTEHTQTQTLTQPYPARIRCRRRYGQRKVCNECCPERYKAQIAQKRGAKESLSAEKATVVKKAQEAAAVLNALKSKSWGLINDGFHIMWGPAKKTTEGRPIFQLTDHKFIPQETIEETYASQKAKVTSQNCIDGGTSVHVAGRSSPVALRHVRVGDRVLSWRPTSRGGKGQPTYAEVYFRRSYSKTWARATTLAVGKFLPPLVLSPNHRLPVCRPRGHNSSVALSWSRYGDDICEDIIGRLGDAGSYILRHVAAHEVLAGDVLVTVNHSSLVARGMEVSAALQHRGFELVHTTTGYMLAGGAVVTDSDEPLDEFVPWSFINNLDARLLYELWGRDGVEGAWFQTFWRAVAAYDEGMQATVRDVLHSLRPFVPFPVIYAVSLSAALLFWLCIFGIFAVPLLIVIVACRYTSSCRKYVRDRRSIAMWLAKLFRIKAKAA
ncbi:unnamed protein product [Vitrella brassicaformis CCMP3155]|uniref:Sushi domain-containing protein n=2 Tax=Vitrella brassicaformis TaxID=1169539 RepID=A0A0G4H2A6_VITBC|nr:unnamed protein product [Vitrella brassicaformis CCMP3155]|eukprot:CEM37770.1 unnamed protein product [Vitrella brassicaformis CCMP3155]